MLSSADPIMHFAEIDEQELSGMRLHNDLRLSKMNSSVKIQAEESVSITPFERPIAAGKDVLWRITVAKRKQAYVIEAAEIEWIRAAGDYTELHVRGATHLLREPLSTLLGRLPADLFCRIHRSFVVNLSTISGFKRLRNQDLLVRLHDKTILRASRTFSLGLRKAIAQRNIWQQSVSGYQNGCCL